MSPTPSQSNWQRIWLPLLAGLAGAAGAVLVIFLVVTVNINLVKADIVYKQGQQFDQQGIL